MLRACRAVGVAFLAAGLHPSGAAAQGLTLDVDGSGADRAVLRAREVIPAREGPLTLFYAKWIPGEHAPSGPIVNLAGLELKAGGAVIPWRRDPLEMTAIHCTVPAGVTSVEVGAEFLFAPEGGSFSAGPSATSQLAVLNWNQITLYPQGRAADELAVTASLRLPPSWDYATALAGERQGDVVRFSAVPLSRLVDSPVLLGAHFRVLDLGEHGGAPHRLALAADSAAALEAPKELAEGLRRLIDEAQALFAGHHYGSYTWLLALSDHVEHFGLEHHESSDDRLGEEALIKEELKRGVSGLLSHEYVHSWNGKYRRPAGLLSPDFQKPMVDGLLWVYEGLTEHAGFLLPVRAGLWTPEYYREQVALLLARLDREPGRQWRPLGDTADAAQILYGAPRAWRAVRRGTDFYQEAVPLWLEVDTRLRAKSGGRLALDDFCHLFHGGAGGPSVKPYSLDDVVTALDGLVHDDWRAFFRERIETVQPRVPMAGLEAAGWRLVYNDTPNAALKDDEERREMRDWTFALGLIVDKDGEVQDVSGPALRAGVVPGMKLLALGGRAYKPRSVEAALREAQATRRPLEAIVQFGEAVQVLHIEALDGPSYPHLERIAGAPDLLAEILKPHATQPSAH